MLYCNTLRLKIGRKRGVRNNEITPHPTPPWKTPLPLPAKEEDYPYSPILTRAVVIPSKVGRGEVEDNGGGGRLP